MLYEWDEDKRRSNLAKHGFDFVDAPQALAGRVLETADVEHDVGEDRWAVLAMAGPVPVKIVYSEPDEDTRRIISMRRATKKERHEYEDHFRN